MLAVSALSCLNGCASRAVTSPAAVCRIQFDYQDQGIDGLNLQNLRALNSFKEACEY